MAVSKNPEMHDRVGSTLAFDSQGPGFKSRLRLEKSYLTFQVMVWIMILLKGSKVPKWLEMEDRLLKGWAFLPLPQKKLTVSI